MDPDPNNPTPPNEGEEMKSSALLDSLYEATAGEDAPPTEEETVQITPSLGDVVAGLGNEDPKPKEDEDPKPKEDEDPKPKEDEDPKPKEDAPKPGEGEEDKKKLKVKEEPAKREELPTFDKPEPKPEDTPKVDIEDPAFTDDQKDRLELAQFAESTGDAKYEGLTKKYAEYFKAHDEFVKKAEAADPEVRFDEYNEEYQEFIRKNQPVLSDREIRKLERGLILQEAENRAEKKFKDRIDEQEAEIRKIKTAPEAKKMVDGFREKLDKGIYPDDLAKLIEEKGIEEVSKTHKFEIETYQEEVSKAASRVDSFVKLAKNLDTFDGNNPDHKWLVDFIDSEGDTFFQRGGEHRFKDGKQFLPREAYYQATQAGKADQYWTFSDSDIVDLLEVRATRDAQAKVTQEIERLEKLGFKRGGETPAAPAPKPGSESVDDSPTPKAAPPAAAPGPGGEGDQGEQPNALFKTLGY